MKKFLLFVFTFIVLGGAAAAAYVYFVVFAKVQETELMVKLDEMYIASEDMPACDAEGGRDYARQIADLELCGYSGKALHDEYMSKVAEFQKSPGFETCAPSEYLRISTSRFYSRLNEVNGGFQTLGSYCRDVQPD